VLSFFSTRLESSNGGSLSVGEVHAIIKQAAVLFKRDRLKACDFLILSSNILTIFIKVNRDNGSVKDSLYISPQFGRSLVCYMIRCSDVSKKIRDSFV
jgi:hypothetical protein